MIHQINYTPEPTPKRFHHSNAQRRGIMGPIGSGKSTACCMEVLSRSMRQKPDAQGVRRTRWAIIRSSYPQLRSTTIKTWQEWIPQGVCPIVYRAPIEGRMNIRLPDKTIMDMTVLFLALDRPQDTEKITSLELTGAWINEARETGPEVIRDIFSRTRRYPPKKVAPLTWGGIIMDTNPPDDDSWWYDLAENEKPPGWQFFRQPGALLPVRDAMGRVVKYKAHPKAENVQHQPLGYEYWMGQTHGVDPEWIMVHCCGQYGSVFSGKPVYQGVYSDALHVATQPLGVYRGRPLFLAFDYGLTPACAIGQLTPSGELRVLRELQCQHGGLKQFLADAVKPLLASLFPGMPVIATGDPAGEAKSQPDETTCVDILEQAGFPYTRVPTNKLVLRREAVMDRLTRMAGDDPAFILDPSCRILRRGFLGGYKFERVQVTGETRFRDQPAKNKFSHLQDALAYLCLLVDTVQTHEPAVVAPPPVPTWAGLS